MNDQLAHALLRAGFTQRPQTAGHNVPEPDPKPTWGSLSEAQRVYFLAAFSAEKADISHL